MLPLEEVRDRLLTSLHCLPSERVGIGYAAGRILAESPVAAGPVPPTDTVSMDGFAVRAADVSEVPCTLEVVGRVAPGQVFAGPLGVKQAVRVFTGAALPTGADAVVMQEEVECREGSPPQVGIQEIAKPWENVRFRGEDVAAGSSLLTPGMRLGPAQLGLLAAAGLGEVLVRRRPRVAILVTGSELVRPGEPLRPGQIHESNGLMLAELLRTEGAEVVGCPPVPDQLEPLMAAMKQWSEGVDLLVTSGGASVGEPDLVRAAITTLGGRVHDGEVALKPGKPFFWADGAAGLVLGLPGNPVSAFVTAILLVLPALRRLAGRHPELPPTTPGILGEPLVNGDSRRHLVRVTTRSSGEVFSAGIQASHRLQALALADGLVDVPPRTTLSTGSWVKVIRWA